MSQQRRAETVREHAVSTTWQLRRALQPLPTTANRQPIQRQKKMTADSPPAPPTARPSHAVPGKVDLDSKFHWGRLLGRGSYADVVLVHSLPPPSHPPDGPFTPVPFAMKIIDKRLIKSNHQLQELLREIRIMRRIRHPSVVRLEEVFETERKVYLQME